MQAVVTSGKHAIDSHAFGVRVEHQGTNTFVELNAGDGLERLAHGKRSGEQRSFRGKS